MRFTGMIVFLLVVTCGASWLNYWLLSKMFAWYRRPAVRYIYILLTVVTLFLMGYGIIRRPPFDTGHLEVVLYLIYAAIAWFVGQLLLLLAQPVMVVLHRLLAEKRPPQPVQEGISRRRFLGNTLAFVPVAALGFSSKGIYEAQAQMVVTRHTLHFESLPETLNGFKVAQVTDTHLGPYFGINSMVRVISLLQQEKPDLVLITGDFADDLSLIKPALQKLGEYCPSVPYGIYYCYGNHDYFQDAAYLKDQFRHSAIKPLENEHVLLVPGAQPFYLLGVDYPWGDEARRGVNVSPDVRRQYFAKANQGLPDNAFKVLMAHHPDALFDGFAAGIPLTIAGHTHGGQILLGKKPILSSYAYMNGLYEEKGVYGYVDSGAGHWFPFRLNCPPQITVFTFSDKA